MKEGLDGGESRECSGRSGECGGIESRSNGKSAEVQR